jgi:hypothetical protein
MTLPWSFAARWFRRNGEAAEKSIHRLKDSWQVSLERGLRLRFLAHGWKRLAKQQRMAMGFQARIICRQREIMEQVDRPPITYGVYFPGDPSRYVN